MKENPAEVLAGLTEAKSLAEFTEIGKDGGCEID
jgi:hypothetical protein